MNFYLWVAVFILISVAAGLIRILKGPTAADSMLAAQLFGTGGVAILLILAQAMQCRLWWMSPWFMPCWQPSLWPYLSGGNGRGAKRQGR